MAWRNEKLPPEVKDVLYQIHAKAPPLSKDTAMSMFRKIVAAALLATFGLAAAAVESSGGATARATDPCFGYAICDH